MEREYFNKADILKRLAAARNQAENIDTLFCYGLQTAIQVLLVLPAVDFTELESRATPQYPVRDAVSSNKFRCPVCGQFLGDGFRYCPDCGQAIDWGGDTP